MTRIPYVRREDLGSEGQRLWDGIVSTWGDLAVTANGGLAGPFNASGGRTRRWRASTVSPAR